uniref:Putative mitochondrial 50S ribosomal protein L53 n=1 Tax=Latrodectus hesperus TaxID=256737 RepID=E7D1Y3_LATHE|nr:putative mitochondrial 50S ribosomal protein L53 [Latrodectus hesperus]
MKDSYKTNINIFNKVYDQLPAFVDVFDEETFYVFVIFFTLGTILVAFILSRFITIKAVD